MWTPNHQPLSFYRKELPDTGVGLGLNEVRALWHFFFFSKLIQLQRKLCCRDLERYFEAQRNGVWWYDFET